MTDYETELRSALLAAEPRRRMLVRRSRARVTAIVIISTLGLGSLAVTQFPNPTTTETVETATEEWGPASSAVEPATSVERVDNEPPAPGVESAFAAFESPLTPGSIDHSATWTEIGLFIVGGRSVDGSTIYAGTQVFSLDDGQWSQAAQDSLARRAGHLAVWTGDRLVVLGGSVGTDAVRTVGAFDPETMTWSELPETPFHGMLDATWFRGAIWVVTIEGLVFRLDEVEEAWLPENVKATGIDARFVTSGDSLYLLSSEVFSSEQGRLDANVLGPGSSDWKQVRERTHDLGLPLGEFFWPNAMAGPDSSLIVWSGEGQGTLFRFHPGRNVWEQGDDLPLPACEGYAKPLTIDNVVWVYAVCTEEPGLVLRFDINTLAVLDERQVSLTRDWSPYAAYVDGSLLDPDGPTSDIGEFAPRVLLSDLAPG